MQDGQVIRDVVADDDGVFGKVQEGRQSLARFHPLGLQGFVADVVDVEGSPDRPAGTDIGVEGVRDLALGIEADGGNLDDFIPRRVGAGAFDVEDDDPAFIQG